MASQEFWKGRLQRICHPYSSYTQRTLEVSSSQTWDCFGRNWKTNARWCFIWTPPALTKTNPQGPWTHFQILLNFLVAEPKCLARVRRQDRPRPSATGQLLISGLQLTAKRRGVGDVQKGRILTPRNAEIGLIHCWVRRSQCGPPKSRGRITLVWLRPSRERSCGIGNFRRGHGVVVSTYLQAIEEGYGDEHALATKLGMVMQNAAGPKSPKAKGKRKWFVEFCCSDNNSYCQVSEACSIPYLGLTESFGDLTNGNEVVFDQVLYWCQVVVAQGDAIDLWGPLLTEISTKLLKVEIKTKYWKPSVEPPPYCWTMCTSLNWRLLLWTRGGRRRLGGRYEMGGGRRTRQPKWSLISIRILVTVLVAEWGWKLTTSFLERNWGWFPLTNDSPPILTYANARIHQDTSMTP